MTGFFEFAWLTIFCLKSWFWHLEFVTLFPTYIIFQFLLLKVRVSLEWISKVVKQSNFTGGFDRFKKLENNHYSLFPWKHTSIMFINRSLTLTSSDFNEFTSVAFLETTKLTSMSCCTLPHSDWLTFHCITVGRKRFRSRGKQNRRELLLSL